MSLRLKHIGRRLVYAVLTVLVLASVTFLLMHLLPGSPFSGEKNITPEVQRALEEKYSLNKPLPQQYLTYMGNLLQGDLGTSLISKRPVTDIIAQAFPVSFDLGLRALGFALVLGLLLGVVAAVWRGTLWDTGVMLLALLGVSVPSFIVGALLQYYLGLQLFKATGLRVFAIMGWSGWNSKLLPTFALAFSAVAVVSRLMRAGLVEALGQDYALAAKAKGLKRSSLVLRHGLRNAIMPVITVLGPLSAVLFTGTFAIENVFAIPGLGKYFVESVRSNDYPVIVGTTLFFGIFLVGANLLVDILHTFVDPRVRAEGGDVP